MNGLKRKERKIGPGLPSRAAGITVSARVDEIIAVRELLRDILEGTVAREEEILKIELAVHEICVNIARYAYPGPQDGYIKVWIEADERSVKVEVRDGGVPFDPAGRPMPDIKERIKQGAKGGLGVYLYKVLSDSYVYSREGGENVLTITGKFGNPASEPRDQ